MSEASPRRRGRVSAAFNIAWWTLAIAFVVIGVVASQPGVILVVLVFAAIHVVRRGSLRSFNDAMDEFEARHRTDDR